MIAGICRVSWIADIGADGDADRSSLTRTDHDIVRRNEVLFFAGMKKSLSIDLDRQFWANDKSA
jgi:hypothetical protein